MEYLPRRDSPRLGKSLSPTQSVPGIANPHFAFDHPVRKLLHGSFFVGGFDDGISSIAIHLAACRD